MDYVNPKPPLIPSWLYDGTNWSTIESEAEQLGMVIDATDNGDGTVTLHTFVLGVPTDVSVPSGSRLVRTAGNALGVVDQEGFDAGYVVVESGVVPPPLARPVPDWARDMVVFGS